MKRVLTRRALASLLVAAGLCGTPLFAQFFNVVFDPENYANALLRFEQLRQQYAQLVLTYEQIRAEYRLLEQQSRKVPVAMDDRYRATPTPWLAFEATPAFGTAAQWVLTANSGHEAAAAYLLATQPLRQYGDALAGVSADESARIETHYDRLQLADASITHGLEALGFLRGHQMSVELAIRNLEDDGFADDPDFNTEIAVLNKINATAVTSTRLAKDANNLLVSLLEQQLLDATERREAAVEGINSHIAFETEARGLLARTTALTTDALSTFRIP